MTDVVPRPTFVFGSGRCGTTILQSVLAEHPDLAWLSNYQEHYPASSAASRVAALRHAPLVRALGDRKGRPKPAEAFRPWDAIFPGFSRPFRDLTEDDLLPETAERFRDLVAATQAAQRKTRFVAKYTGWARVGFFRAAFPDARFVYVLRDGRAVASSLLRVHWWDGWQGPSQWHWGPLADEDAERWAETRQSFAGLAGLQWKILVQGLPAWQDALGPRLRIVRYEDFVEDPRGTFEGLLDWLDLPATDPWWHRFSSHRIEAGRPWEKTLTARHRSDVEHVAGELLGSLGYL
jgi:hypothetical protein